MKIRRICSVVLLACMLVGVIPGQFIFAKEAEEEHMLTAPEEMEAAPALGYGGKLSQEDEGIEAPSYGRSGEKKAATSGKCGAKGDDISWNYKNGKLTVKGTGSMKDFPSGAPWASYRSKITEVEVKNGVTYLGEASFYGCTRLKKASLPKSLTEIGKGAFGNCYQLSEIKLPNKMGTIQDYAFQNSGLTEILLPASLKSISPLAFFKCAGLKDIFVSPENMKYASWNGVLFSWNGSTLYLYPQGKEGGTYTVPRNVAAIGDYAFLGSGISKISIPGSVKRIGDSAFRESRLTGLTIPSSVKEIGNFLCYKCSNLKTLVIKKGLEKLSYQAFYGCRQLSSVNLGSITDLNYLAFAYCSSLKKITIPKGVTSIKNGSFGECAGLTQVTLPDGLQEIAYQAFLNCRSLTGLTLPGKLRVIQRYAFYGCSSLKSVTLPSSLEELGDHAFPDAAKLKNMPDSVTKQDDGSYKVTAQVKIKGQEVYSKSFQVLKQVNKERKRRGLKSLTMDKKLLEAAMKRAAETSLYWSHTRPNGSDCFTICDGMWAENIASGYASPTNVMTGWMNSSGHKANILSKKSKSIGIGCFEIDGRYYWVQCFGTQKASGVKASSYQDKNKSRTISVAADEKYYKPQIQFGEKIKAGEKSSLSVTWYNGSTTIEIPLTSLKYSSADTSICTVSKGVIRGIDFGTTTVKAWFPGFEKGAVKIKVRVKGGTPVQRDTYTVKFQPNGGTNLSKASKKVTQGAKIGTLPKVERKGYLFQGWYTKKSQGAKVTVNTAIKTNQTLYARWSKVKKPNTPQNFSVTQGKSKETAIIQYQKVRNADGYEIVYSMNKKFLGKSSTLIRTTGKKKTITKLASQKTYYVKVRAYTLDSAGNRIYGNYSEIRQVKIK